MAPHANKHAKARMVVSPVLDPVAWAVRAVYNWTHSLGLSETAACATKSAAKKPKSAASPPIDPHKGPALTTAELVARVNALESSLYWVQWRLDSGTLLDLEMYDPRLCSCAPVPSNDELATNKAFTGGTLGQESALP